MIRRETAESDLFIDFRFETPGDEVGVVGAAGGPRGDSGAVTSPSPSTEAGDALTVEEDGGAADGNGLEVARALKRSEAMAATAGAEA